MTKKDSNKEPRVIKLNPQIPEENPNEEPSDAEESSEDQDNIIDFDPIPEEIIVGLKFGAPIYCKPHYAEIDEEHLRENLGELILEMYEQGKLNDQPSQMPIIGENKIYFLKLRYEDKKPSKFLIETHIEIPTIDAGLRFLSKKYNYESEHIISLVKRLNHGTCNNERYIGTDYKDDNPYKELERFIGKKYDGSLNLKELEPFKGFIFGEKQGKGQIVYEEYEYYCEHIKMKSPRFNTDLRSIGGLIRIIEDELFKYEVISICHKEFKVYPEPNVRPLYKKKSQKPHFKQVFEVKLNSLNLSINAEYY